MAMGSGKKKNRRLYIIVAIVVVAVLVTVGVVAAKSGGTKIDPSKIEKSTRATSPRA